MRRVLIAFLLCLCAFPSWAAFAPFAVAGPAGCSTPTNSVAPAVTPTSGSVGQLFTSTSGTWTGSPTFAYQWYQVDLSSPISGATSSTYTAVSGDVGHTLGSQVVATSGACSSSAVASNTTSAITSGGGGAVAFALPTGSTLKYINPAGNDSCNGTSPSLGSSGACAWLTPNHAMNCGEVIIAATGSYANYQSWGTVSNCPSTTGGIDSLGGVQFATLLCAGTLQSCTNTHTSSGPAIRINANHWSVQGWHVNSSGGMRAYEGNGCITGGPGQIAYIAFINDVSANNLQATDTNDCGAAASTSVPSNAGVDYFATVGVIAQNSSQDTICLSAIDVVGPGVLDTNSGTHYFIYGNFSYANTNTHCQTVSDTEDYMADTWDQHDVTTQGIFSNNIGYDSDRMCIQTFWQNVSSDAATIKIYNNTCFQNNNQTGTDNLDGEINLASTTANIPWVLSVTNNVAYQPNATSGGGKNITAFALYNTTGTPVVFGGTGANNVMRSNRPSCSATFCNSTFDAQVFNQSGVVPGTNTYTNPLFTNTTDLLANQVGVPNCTGFVNTTQCMGWNANTSTLTTPSVISDLVPTASGTAGKGYQQPSVTCATNADYPTWLKGIVYLQWNGTSLTENADLVTKPCGL